MLVGGHTLHDRADNFMSGDRILPIGVELLRPHPWLFLWRGEYSWVHSLTGLPKQAGINQNKYPHATLGMADAGGFQA